MMKIVVLLQCCFLILKIPRALCEKRKTIKIEKRGFPHGWDIGVRKYFDPGDQKEVTICMRFRTFSYNEGMGWPFHMTNHCTDPDDMWQEACYDKFGWNFAIGWKTGLEDDNRQAGQTFLWFSHDNQTAREVDFQGAEITRWHWTLQKEWLYPFNWQRVCCAWSIRDKFLRAYVNGKLVLGYEWSLQLKKGWGDTQKELQIGVNWRGEVTDVNLYGSAFGEEQMKRWTTSCESPTPGDILAWQPETYNITDTNETSTIISEISAKDLCSVQGADVLEVFDDKELKSPIMSENLCLRLNGRLKLIPNSDEGARLLVKEWANYLSKTNLTSFAFWVGGQSDLNRTEMMESKDGYQVFPKDGLWVFKDPATGDAIGSPLLMAPSGATYAKVTQECPMCNGKYDPEVLITPKEKSASDAETVSILFIVALRNVAMVFSIGG